MSWVGILILVLILTLILILTLTLKLNIRTCFLTYPSKQLDYFRLVDFNLHDMAWRKVVRGREG